MTEERRERAVPCQRCRRDTWNIVPVCNACRRREINVDFSAFTKAMKRVGTSIRIFNHSHRLLQVRLNPAISLADRHLLEQLQSHPEVLDVLAPPTHAGDL